MTRLRKIAVSLPLPGLADGSLAAEPGGDNSTQKITVEKQQAVHYSSVAYALISYGKTQPQRISPLTAYPVISVSCLTGRVEIYLGVTRDAPLHDYTQTCSRCARGLMCLEFDSWGEFWAVVLHGVQTVCPELCWSHLSSHQFPENKG